MIYLSGCVLPELQGAHPDIGFMLTPMMGNRPDLSATLWAADNGCFAQPERYSDEMFRAFLERNAEHKDRCLFATAPDVVGDAAATWARSKDALPWIRALGYPAALVAQDGLESLPVDWDAFDVLFVGGSTEWKLSEHAWRLAREADAHGKWVHMGRVNSWKRLKACAVWGYDSADGTYLAWGPQKNLPNLMKWTRWLRQREEWQREEWCSA